MTRKEFNAIAPVMIPVERIALISYLVQSIRQILQFVGYDQADVTYGLSKIEIKTNNDYKIIAYVGREKPRYQFVKVYSDGYMELYGADYDVERLIKNVLLPIRN